MKKKPAPKKKPVKKTIKKKVAAKKAAPKKKTPLTKREKVRIKKAVKRVNKVAKKPVKNIAEKAAPKKAVIKEVWTPAEYKPKVKKVAKEGFSKTNEKWIADMRRKREEREAAEALAHPKAKQTVIKSSAKVKLVRFRRETDTEYAARVGDAKQQARLTSRGKKLSNKLIAYLLLHNALSVYADIATLSEMQTAAGHKLRATRVVKIRNVLRKRSRKMLKYVNALLEKRGVIEEEQSSTPTTAPEEITDAETAQVDANTGGGEAGGSNPVQPLENFINGGH